MKSELKDQIRLVEMVRASNWDGVVNQMREFPDILKETCAENNKGHCSYNPLYAVISAPMSRMTEAFIDYALSQNSSLLDIISFRVDLLSYLVMNKDEPELVQKFIDLGMDVNNQNDYTDMNWKVYKPNFNTPAHTAVMRNHSDSLKVLANNGADLSLQNLGKATPMDLYFYNSYRLDDEVLDVLISNEADFATNRFGYATGLTRAINAKKWDALDKILDYTQADLKKFQLDRMVRKMSEDQDDSQVAKSVVEKALAFMPDNFDRSEYSEFICKTVANSADCKNLFSDSNDESESVEPLVSGVGFMDIDAFSELVADDTFSFTADV